jgi:hypothetical protein
MKALVRYHYKIDPDTLSWDELADIFTELRWIRNEEKKTTDS